MKINNYNKHPYNCLEVINSKNTIFVICNNNNKTTMNHNKIIIMDTTTHNKAILK